MERHATDSRDRLPAYIRSYDILSLTLHSVPSNPAPVRQGCIIPQVSLTLHDVSSDHDPVLMSCPCVVRLAPGQYALNAVPLRRSGNLVQTSSLPPNAIQLDGDKQARFGPLTLETSPRVPSTAVLNVSCGGLYVS
jgi:hypothetical protein